MLSVRKSVYGVVLASAVLCGQSFAQSVELDSDGKKQAYAIGTMLGGQMLEQFSQDNNLDMSALAAGLADAVNGQSQLTLPEAEELVKVYQQNAQAQLQAEGDALRQQGEQYLEANRAKEGVIETESGLQYSIIESGDPNGTRPAKEDTVVVDYRGTLVDGTEFDSSYSRGVPATFPVGGVIPGWVEGLQLMRPGDKWQFVIPSELAYGSRGAGAQIPPHSTLIFEVELKEIK